MATAEESGANGNTTTTSSYGGGGAGAGGKFRKKPFRRQTTPYDRPAPALRGNNGNSTSWLTKLVVDPASKLISYGAQRFFASVFRKRLPPVPPPQPPEASHDMSDGLQGAVPDNEDGVQEPAGGECSPQVNISCGNGITELEQLLRQKTFTKYEIDHLTALLQSRAEEASLGNDWPRKQETALPFGTYQQSVSCPLEEDRNEKTPVVNRKALEDDIAASPAELAKAYMGSRPSKVSPSMLGMRGQAGREENVLFTSRSPILPLANKTSVSTGALQNGLITPKSRGRSGVYNMARTPYSRIQPSSILKGSGISNNGYVRPSMPSSRSLVEHDENFESKPMTLKRRSSVLDDEIGSVGPVRRIRQKPNLLAPRFPHTSRGVGSGSDVKQKLPLIDEPKHKISVTVGENENESVPSTSYARVPSKSSEVAARILQHLEMLTPADKSSVSKSVALRDKSPFKLTPSMLRGQALRSMEDMDSAKLLHDVQDDHTLEDRSNATFPNARDSTSKNQGKIEENGPKESLGPSDTWNTVLHNDSKSSVEASGRSLQIVDSGVKNSGAQPPQKKRAFRMSAQEDFMEQDDDIHCNGLVSQPFSEGRGPMEVPSLGRKLIPSEEPNLAETTIQREVKSTLGHVSSKQDEFGSPGALKFGEGSSSISFSTSEYANAASKAVAATDKPKETENPPALGISSKIVDKFPSLPLESSSKKIESTLESSSRVVSVSSPTGSQMKTPEPHESIHLNPLKAGDKNEASDTVPSAASNGPLVTSAPPFSFTAASFNTTNQISTSNAPQLGSSSSFSIPDVIPSSTVTGSSSASIGSTIFGSTVAPSTTAGPVFKFGGATDLSPAVSAAPSAKIFEIPDLKTKDEIGPRSGSSGSSHSTVVSSVAASTANSTMPLGSSSAADNIQQNFLFSTNKPLFATGSASQGTSNQADSVASLPSFSMNSNTAIGSSMSNSQMFNTSKAFSFSVPASSSAATTVFSSGGPTPNAASLGASSTSVASSFSSNASSATFSFGLSSSSTLTNAVGSSGSSGNAPVFSFSSSSLVTAPPVTSASSFSCGTGGIFGFGGSSASSSAVNSFSSNGANVFSSSWEAPKATSAFPSPSTGFSFGGSSASAPSNAVSPIFSSSTGASSGPNFSFTAAATGPSSGPNFSFTAASASVSSAPSPSPSLNQPIFGNPPSNFAASSFGNNDQMNAEDSMAEDTVPASAPSLPVFGQPAVSPSPSPSPSGFIFGSTPSQPSPFQFGGQQNQVAPPNLSPFQSSGSLEFNAGGGFSVGSGGGDKSSRRIVRISKDKNRIRKK